MEKCNEIQLTKYKMDFKQSKNEKSCTFPKQNAANRWYTCGARRGTQMVHMWCKTRLTDGTHVVQDEVSHFDTACEFHRPTKHNAEGVYSQILVHKRPNTRQT